MGWDEADIPEYVGFYLPALTRRRYPERQDRWHVNYGDV
jgi:hypothetical protein